MSMDAGFSRQIVRHGITMLLRNWRQALGVSVGPIIIGVVAVVLLMIASGIDSGTMQAAAERHTEQMSGMSVLAVLLALCIILAVSAWIAVAWHRFILREEYPGLLPALQGQTLAAYVWRSILVTLVLVLVMLPANAVISLIMIGLGFLPAMLVGLAGGFALGLVFTWLWLRIGLVLPAAALGQKMNVVESWRQTRPASEQILVVSAIFMLLNVVLQIVISLFEAVPVLGLALNFGLTWWMMMLGLCLLTTLYGVLVEGRELPRD